MMASDEKVAKRAEITRRLAAEDTRDRLYLWAPPYSRVAIYNTDETSAHVGIIQSLLALYDRPVDGPHRLAARFSRGLRNVLPNVDRLLLVYETVKNGSYPLESALNVVGSAIRSTSPNSSGIVDPKNVGVVILDSEPFEIIPLHKAKSRFSLPEKKGETPSNSGEGRNGENSS